MALAVANDDVARLRQFNRAYTRFLGTLDAHYLNTAFSLTQGRVMLEIATQVSPQAKTVGAALGLDAGYLSRILAHFRRDGLVQRTPGRDRRVGQLRLTARGQRVLRTLHTRANRQAGEILGPLPAAGRTQLMGALATVDRLVLQTQTGPKDIHLRAPQPGDWGTVVSLEGAGYAAQLGWDASFEALVARIVADFGTNFDAARERCWIADMGGLHVGHIFLVRHPERPDTAKLRLLYVDAAVRGRGVGARLVDECLAFARLADYRKVTLWTQSVLTSARRIYQAAGFVLVSEEPHHSFGYDLMGQTWELDLTAAVNHGE